MGDKAVFHYSTDKNKISSIIDLLKNWSYNDLIKTDYCKVSFLEKNTDENLLKRYFSEFKRMHLICHRVRIGREDNYDLYYELDNGDSILYAINLNKKPPVLINAFLTNKNLKNFIRSIMKRYGKDMI